MGLFYPPPNSVSTGRCTPVNPHRIAGSSLFREVDQHAREDAARPRLFTERGQTSSLRRHLTPTAVCDGAVERAENLLWVFRRQYRTYSPKDGLQRAASRHYSPRGGAPRPLSVVSASDFGHIRAGHRLCHRGNHARHGRGAELLCGVQALVTEEHDPVAEGPGLNEPEVDLGVRRPEQRLPLPNDDRVDVD